MLNNRIRIALIITVLIAGLTDTPESCRFILGSFEGFAQAQQIERAGDQISSGTETSYLVDSKSGVAALSEEGDPLEEITILPDSKKFRAEVDQLYGDFFQIVMERSPDIRIAAKSRQQKYYEKYTATAERFAPEIDFLLSQEHRYNYDEELGAISEITGEREYVDGPDVTDWGFGLDFPVVRRPTSVTLDIARKDFELADNSLSITLNNLDSRLRELIGNYMVAVYRYLNLENSVALSKEHVVKIKRGYELRDQTRLALLRAQANLKGLESRVDLERQRKDSALRDLLDFSGLEPTDPLLVRLDDLLTGEKQSAEVISSFAQVEDSLAAVSTYVDQMSDEELFSFYQANSELYHQLELQRDLSESRADRFTQGEWPDLSVRADYGRKEDTSFSDYESDGAVGLYLRVPIFTGGTLFSNVKTQGEAKQIALEQLRDDNRKLFNRIANRREAILSLRDVYEKQKINLLQQEEIVQLSIKSYTIKQTSMQDLLTSKNQLIEAKNLLLRTTMDIGSQARLLAWELGRPLTPPVPIEQESL